ncbi:hypothetical protein NCCP2495_10970 [Dietzia sp. NCCP-2495]|uniref:HdeD family acid-resistance protein n=1 Tax=Dietzia sp. NCCP-2495 TaxID=2934675 RepID=UPI002231DB14|nr:DUF308 domain-containing protein [Dietzia sp. NCCP-2495]GLB63219.1 hypothetical protein NCCP2495_10970 [Dietzia sp. NCCP-2495]
MSTSAAARGAKGMRLALITGGLVAIAFGIAVLVWPAKTAAAITGIIAFWAIVAGLIYIAMALVDAGQSTASRVGHALLGLLYVAAGVYAIIAIQSTTIVLAFFITLMIGIMWIIEGFTALFALGEPGSKGLTIVFAVISVLAGISLVSTPLWGAGFLWWLVGVSLLVLGALNLIRGLLLKS